MTTKDKAQDMFMKFRQIPPSSPYTGIGDIEAKECVKVLISELIKEKEEYSAYYRQVLKHVDKCRVK